MVNVKIVPTTTSPEGAPSGNLKIKIMSEEPKPISVELLARRALNGDVMILDHDLVDIIISPTKNKITTFPKKLMRREVYPVQDRYYSFLRKKGVIDPASIQSGNVFSSMEAKIYESILEGIDSIQSAIFATSLFIEEERPDIKARKHLHHDMMTHMLDPDEEESTELGEVPHSDKKGSLDHKVRPYGFQYMYSVLRESEGK
tara:strand:- start:211 stop:816 length:606 start_codon:yes stop_codon:yes gene_type:complete